MRHFGIITALALVACSATGRNHAPQDATPAVPEQAMATSPAARPAESGTFAGIWQDCDDGASPDECSRYRLLQRGDRICGTWSYIATGDGYEGRLIARALSASDARRTRTCGRPGSEARTECESGWDRIDKPLHLCEGRLSDGIATPGECRARFERVVDARAELASLAGEPWMESCLSGAGPEDAR